MRNETTDLREDEVFLAHSKPYMAAISPCFSTHYGTSGQWAFNKYVFPLSRWLKLKDRNWICALIFRPVGHRGADIQIARMICSSRLGGLNSSICRHMPARRLYRLYRGTIMASHTTSRRCWARSRAVRPGRMEWITRHSGVSRATHPLS